MNKIKSIILLLSLFGLAACSSGGGETVETAGSSIDSLPANTDPVVETSSSSLMQKAVAALEAVTGLELSAWSDSSNWQASNSRAMCEVGLGLKEALSEAMNPDKIKCYVGAVAKHAGVGDPSTDGSDNYFRLTNFPEAQGFEPRIRFQIQKSATGQIQDFKMWSCFAQSGSNYVQTEYISQVVGDDLSVTSFSKYKDTENNENWGSTSNVTGTLNSDYQWTSKSMELQRYYSGDFGDHSQELDITQRASSFVVSGYNAGSWGQDIFTNSFYAVVQGLNMSSPRSIALGDGSANANFTWCYDSNSDSSCAAEGQTFSDSSIQSWNGDTRQNLGTASDGDYHSEVASASVPTASSVSAISFSGDEVWDCSAESFTDADLSNMENTSTALGQAFAACDAKFDYRDNVDGGYACDAAQ